MGLEDAMERLEETDKETQEVQLVDTWNHAGEYENAFFSAPFQKVLLKRNAPGSLRSSDKSPTHIFKVKAPLLKNHEAV